MNGWKPDQQSSIVIAILGACIILAFYRSMFPSVTEDKILDMMVTILFSTCLVTITNYHFGSSRGSALKDETQAKVTEKLAEHAGTGDGTMRTAVAAAALAAPAAAAVAAPPAAAVAAPPVVNEVVPPAVEKAVAEAIAAHDELEKQK